MGWGYFLPLAPPVITGVVWLMAGDSAPSSPDEPWPRYRAAALYSIGFVTLATPIVLGIALFWVLAEPAKDESPL